MAVRTAHLSQLRWCCAIASVPQCSHHALYFVWLHPCFFFGEPSLTCDAVGDFGLRRLEETVAGGGSGNAGMRALERPAPRKKATYLSGESTSITTRMYARTVRCSSSLIERQLNAPRVART